MIPILINIIIVVPEIDIKTVPTYNNFDSADIIHGIKMHSDDK